MRKGDIILLLFVSERILITLCRSLEGVNRLFFKFQHLIPTDSAWTGQTDPPDRSEQTDSHQQGKSPFSSLNLYGTWSVYFAEYFYQYE